MGNDTNQSPRKPRTPGKAIADAPNPFKSRRVERDAGRLEDTPGVLGAIESICAGGRAVVFAKTRDGGAWAIQILDGDARFKDYAADQLELDSIFANLIDAYGADA